jgi:hypothetical protein
MPILLPGEVEPIRVGKLLRIAIRRAGHEVHALALADPLAADLQVVRRNAHDRLRPSVVPQQLLYCNGEERRIIAEESALVRMVQQRQDPFSNRLRCALAAREQQLNA